ncbi:MULTISPECIES: LacI family DNA-binding transcriptional regulator [unclassified Planococcus (in: firmicutes)]|uniref:LacI family DNA-binding transcriptional regulator n=1 Tax=unclassified Planococcus (in: firmicutes) TaxID=2662419 RepID=UPI000C33F945|nr:MULTISPECIES: LacI family DNA-binding transcriptional regulator [unclassified Planococcus (in: firmicutes)]AUD13111.1 transcriptional regulator [Planococcus sp. MB-3u-03]PKG45406.1 transcriptional regulator [Planococcus sp. Urea-trap-24]PKG88998.1 transcriptional regulator [Planococcus sp. Urea-3u-39]PKH36366.1 transcriptional regulator [Planococcus sp. MB-3u-09]
MTITIKDLAVVAGVSYSTVSKALNDSSLVKPETKDRIIKIAKEMGYEPNYAAQRLVSKESKVIGLIWPTLERVAPSVLVTKINEEISKSSYSMILSVNPLQTSLEMFKRFQVDGVIIFNEYLNDMPTTFPLPCLTYGVKKDTPFPVIDVNYQGAMNDAVMYLYELGHRDIAFIGDLTTDDERQIEKAAGFKKAMKKFGIYQEDHILDTEGLGWYDGYMATVRLINSPYRPTAIISASYDISAGLIRALRQENYTIPNDISVLSYDNIPQMANMEIPLTSVGAPVEEIAQAMVQTLTRYIKDPDSVPAVQTLTPVITERSSCAAIGTPTEK